MLAKKKVIFIFEEIIIWRIREHELEQENKFRLVATWNFESKKLFKGRGIFSIM